MTAYKYSRYAEALQKNLSTKGSVFLVETADWDLYESEADQDREPLMYKLMHEKLNAMAAAVNEKLPAGCPELSATNVLLDLRKMKADPGYEVCFEFGPVEIASRLIEDSILVIAIAPPRDDKVPDEESFLLSAFIAAVSRELHLNLVRNDFDSRHWNNDFEKQFSVDESFSVGEVRIDINISEAHIGHLADVYRHLQTIRSVLNPSAVAP